MRFSDLPPDVLGLIFTKIDLDYLYCLQTLFPLNCSNQICRVIETVRYSRLIVTNSWRQLLRLLPRAKKISSLDLLSRYTYMSIADFQEFIPVWQSKLHPEVNVKRKVVFVLCCDHSNVDERYLIIRRFTRLLRTMPSSVLNVTRQIFLFMTGLSLLIERDLDEEVISLLFRRIEQVASLHNSLETVSLVGPVEAHETGCIAWPVGYDYSNFSHLTTVCLSNMGLVSISGISLPQSIKHLVVSHNSIVSLAGITFPETLATLDLSYNNLTGSFKTSLPLELRVLNVRRNYIEDMMFLPDSIEDLDISFNELPSTLFRIPLELKVLRTDIAQFYLMSENVQTNLRLQQVCIKKNIASQPNEAIFTRL